MVEADVSTSADNINSAREYKLRFDYPISPLNLVVLRLTSKKYQIENNLNGTSQH